MPRRAARTARRPPGPASGRAPRPGRCATRMRASRRPAAAAADRAGLPQAGAPGQRGLQQPVDQVGECQAARLPHLLEIGRGRQPGDRVDLVDQDLARPGCRRSQPAPGPRRRPPRTPARPSGGSPAGCLGGDRRRDRHPAGRVQVLRLEVPELLAAVDQQLPGKAGVGRAAVLVPPAPSTRSPCPRSRPRRSPSGRRTAQRDRRVQLRQVRGLGRADARSAAGRLDEQRPAQLGDRVEHALALGVAEARWPRPPPAASPARAPPRTARPAGPWPRR